MLKLLIIMVCSFPESGLDDVFYWKVFRAPIKELHVLLDLRLERDISHCSISTLRGEMRESLAQNYPSSSYCFNFGYDTTFRTTNILQFCCHYIRFCREKVTLGGAEGDSYLVILEEAIMRHKIYDTLDDILRVDNTLFRRRSCLAKLRFLLGEEAFYSGSLPCFVPVHRFLDFP